MAIGGCSRSSLLSWALSEEELSGCSLRAGRGILRQPDPRGPAFFLGEGGGSMPDALELALFRRNP